jgi:hypothetical protein
MLCDQRQPEPECAGAVCSEKWIQRLPPLSRLDATGIYRLKNEFRSVASLVHENLVRLYELHADGERWFFTMSLVEGVPFTDHVREDAELGFSAHGGGARRE